MVIPTNKFILIDTSLIIGKTKKIEQEGRQKRKKSNSHE